MNFTVQNDTEAVNFTGNSIILILNDPFSALCYGISLMSVIGPYRIITLANQYIGH